MSPHDLWYDWYGLNSRLFLIINGCQSVAIDKFMLGVSTLSHPALYPPYIAIALMWSRARPASLPQRNIVVFALGYVLTSMLAIPLLKNFFDFPRPVEVLGDMVKLVGAHDQKHAFPSGHAAFAVLASASLLPNIARIAQFGLIAFALLACVSRIWIGAHYPADVLAGGLIALAIVGASSVVVKRGTEK